MLFRSVFFERLKHRRVFDQKVESLVSEDESSGLEGLSQKLQRLALSKSRRYDPTSGSFTRKIMVDPLKDSRKYHPLVTGPLPGDLFPDEVVRQTASVAWVNKAMNFLEKLKDYEKNHEISGPLEGVESADFGKFLEELEPVPNEVVRSYTRAILGKDPSLQGVLQIGRAHV